MRYLVAIAAVFVVLMVLTTTTGFGTWPAPWGAIARAALGIAVALGVLALWERIAVRMGRRDAAPAAGDAVTDDAADTDDSASEAPGTEH